MKRFTETTKWSDPWFRRLSAGAKMLWLYILDHCDVTGLADLDLKFASQDIGLKVSDEALAELGERIERFEDGKVFVPKFISFQYGRLSEACPAHKKVITLIQERGILQDCLGYHYPKARVTDRVSIPLILDKDKKGIEEDRKGTPSPVVSKSRCTLEEAQAFAKELGLPERDGESCFYKWEGNGWKNGTAPIKDWKATIRAWKAGGYLPSQKAGNSQPSTTSGETLKEQAARLGIAGYED